MIQNAGGKIANTKKYRLRSFERSRNPDEHAARNALQPVFAAGELELQPDEVHHLCEREGDHREVDAGAPDREAAEHPAKRERERGASEDAEPGRSRDPCTGSR